MLEVFYLDAAYVLQWLQMCFPGVLDVCCKCFNYFGHMLQSISSRCYKTRSDVAHVAVGPTAATARPACMRMEVEGA
jgi:hypothetical protein